MANPLYKSTEQELLENILANLGDYSTQLNNIKTAIDTTNINTKQPDTVTSGSGTLANTNALQIINITKAGYITITAPSTNAGTLFIGNGSSQSDGIEPGTSRTVSASNISLFYLKGTTNDKYTYISGYVA